MNSSSFNLLAAVHQSYEASLELARATTTERNQALKIMAAVLRDRQNLILEANTLDLETSRELAVPEIVLGWLKLTPERLLIGIKILEQLAEMPDPLGRISSSYYQVSQCQTYRQQVPLGVIAFIYEAFPDLLPVMAGMCLKTGNSLVTRGGGEASHTSSTIAEALQLALEEAGLPPGCFTPLPSDQGASIKELVALDQFLNLVIPYGRPTLVQQVVRQSTAPILRASMGNCYLYWSSSGGVEMARSIILDSHQSEPDPVNAIEKVLVHADLNSSSLAMLWNSLRDRGFELKGDAALVADFPELKLAGPEEWQQPYLSKTIAFKGVDNLETAIAWINTNSSGHADCLITESYRESRIFALEVNSALTFINASPRFSRNIDKNGGFIFLGMSNQKGYRRGLIDLEALTTTKNIVQGNGRLLS
jgi:glutamate-5-semialdehyde dehydrogenase